MRTNLKIPEILVLNNPEPVQTIQAILCSAARHSIQLKNQSLNYETAKCSGISCSACLLHDNNKHEFLAWFETERGKGKFKLA